MPVQIPCGQCISCRLERSKQWAIRCIHEASLYDSNAFITLTYNEANLPQNGSLEKRHFQLFMKKLRKEIAPRKVRFFHCGEYGEQYSRPHYHACIFNYGFPDKTLWSVWKYGYSTIGDVTFQSAAYVARYILKKVLGESSQEHYEAIKKSPEYTTMSNRPGIGRKYLDKYKQDIYQFDNVILNNQRLKPPRYYDNIYDITNPKEMAKVKGRRKQQAMEQDKSPKRLAEEDKHITITSKRLVREIEEETS